MAAVSDFEHITRAITFGLRHVEELEANVVTQLETGASTSLVNALRTATMYYSILCIGGLSVFEATLQQSLGWTDSFNALDAHLRANAMDDLAERFRDYKDAINVLKHGEGRSYERLLARKMQLTFTVKDRGRAFFEEGDVSEVIRLIDADAAFARQCVTIVEEVVKALGKTSGIVL